mmetsp:Transcript_27796/g.74125  ORF Transcript_27796/g.74125 Transcript_27796/m.74125 type:complete len:227 (-) Transcript_27796:1390-2070(-)
MKLSVRGKSAPAHLHSGLTTCRPSQPESSVDSPSGAPRCSVSQGSTARYRLDVLEKDRAAAAARPRSPTARATFQGRTAPSFRADSTKDNEDTKSASSRQPMPWLWQHHSYFATVQPDIESTRPSWQSKGVVVFSAVVVTVVAAVVVLCAFLAAPCDCLLLYSATAGGHPIFSFSQHHCIAFFLPVVGVPETFERLLQMYPPSSGSHGNGLSPVALRPSTGLGHLK